jgi:hypothetical protein
LLLAHAENGQAAQASQATEPHGAGDHRSLSHEAERRVDVPLSPGDFAGFNESNEVKDFDDQRDGVTT